MEFVYFVWVVQFIGKKLFIIFLYFCFCVCILVLVSCVFSLLLLVIRARGLSIISVFFIQRTNFWLHWVFSSVQFSSVAQSCPTLCNPMNHSRPGLPVHHQLTEFTQTHVHRVSDTIQPSHPLSSPSPPAPNPPSIRVFSNESTLHMRWPKYWKFQLQHHSFQRNPKADLLQNGLVGSPCSPRDSQESSPTP